MKLRQMLLILLVIGSIILTGCQQETSKYVPDVVCNKPYIRMGLDCCLDTNDNSICDTDESTNLAETNERNENVIKECFIINEETSDKKGSGILCDIDDDCIVLFDFDNFKDKDPNISFNCQESEVVLVPELTCTNAYNCLGFEDNEDFFSSDASKEGRYLFTQCFEGVCQMTPSLRDLLLEPKQSVTYVPK